MYPRQAGVGTGQRPGSGKVAILMTLLTNAPVDPRRFAALIFMGCEAKLDRETGIQHTSKDGSAAKWTVQIAASKPSQFDPSKMDGDVLAVTVTSAGHPAPDVPVGAMVTLEDFTVGVMPPESREGGKISGGRLFWSATGVRVLTGAKT